MIDAKLMDILACPQCKGILAPVQDDTENPRLMCSTCQLAFPIQDNIPVLLLDRAEKLVGNGSQETSSE